MNILDGKQTASAIKAEIAEEVTQMIERGERAPHLVAILVGHDGGSESYVANKVKACEACGFNSSLLRFNDDITEQQLLDEIKKLNEDADVDGFIVQLPLPKHINEQKVTDAIDFRKDVDGFHPINVGRLSIGLPGFRSATPAGIMDLIERYGIETKGKHAVVLGRSNIVGKPIATLLMQKAQPGDCTVTVVVIDVGTTRVPDASRKSGFRLCGDVDFDNVAPKCSYITPVPGGVGPMTICSLMKNTLLARKGIF